MARTASIPVAQTLTMVETTREQSTKRRVSKNEHRRGRIKIHLLAACRAAGYLLLRALHVVNHLLPTRALLAGQEGTRRTADRVFVTCV